MTELSSSSRFRADELELTYPVTRSTQVWNGAVFGLKEELVQLPGQDKPLVRQFLDHAGAVGIVALKNLESPAGPQILLMRQYRHPVRAQLWEIPAGLLDVPGEDPLSAAKRELREEADLEAHRWDLLIDMFTSPGASSEALRIFVATEIFELPEKFPRAEEEALMLSEWVPLHEAAQAVLGGQVHSPTAIAGILGVYARQSQPDWPRRAINDVWLKAN